MSIASLDGASSPAAERVLPALDFVDHPALAVAHLLAGGLLEILGPVFWAVLAAGFIAAECAPR